jgi:hypothetical protein
VTLRGEPSWGGLAAPAAAPSVNGSRPSGSVPIRSADNGAASDSTPVEDLETEVYAARDLHGEERTKARRALTKARSRMSEATYRRALLLARDSGLLTIQECLDGARAMEWQPMPRPEFSLATIEAAVAEQERLADQRTSTGGI